MALQVWLPLNGNLNNQGLAADWTFGNTAPSYITVDNAGKIGKCYSFNSTANNSGISAIDNGFMDKYINNRSWTIAAWVMTTSSDTIVVSLSYGLRMFAGDASHTSINLYNSSMNIGCSSSVAVNDGKWHHIAGMYDVNTNLISMYVDGICRRTNTYTSGYTYASSWTNGLYVGKDPNNSTVNDHYLFNGKMNDVRIYDNALSPREVAELAKGLVLHYPLGDSYLEGTTNLYATLDGVTTGCYNGATSKYGYGANTDIYKTTGTFNGKNSLKIYIGTSGASARPYVYFGNLFTSNGTNAPEYKTLSFDYYGTIGTYINFYKLGSGSGTGTWRNVTTSSTGTFTNSGSVTVAPNQWNHIELVLHGTTDANAEWGYGILGDTHTSNTANYWLFANVQLETKDHATGFANYGTTRAGGEVYDTSGFGNNGTTSGSLSVTSDTPRYGNASVFSNSYITREPIPATVPATLSIWVKFNTLGNQIAFVDSGTKLGFGIYNSYFLINYGSSCNKVFSTSAITANTWHHYCVVKDTSSTVTFYIDGVAQQVATGFADYWSETVTICEVGGRGSGTLLSGSASDVRVYATALTADQVKQLYNAPISLANNGTLFANEFNET